MFIDSTQFPLVWIQLMKSTPDTDSSAFTDFEALLARKEAFILINNEGVSNDEGEHSHTKEEAKKVTLWMKRNKVDLKTYIRAGIYIEPNPAKRLAAKAFTLIYEKFWGYPMLIVATKDEALTLAQRLLLEQRPV